jgi:hypothetical protein
MCGLPAVLGEALGQQLNALIGLHNRNTNIV